jgi:hypothetical protein|tara:strand:+ start:365 stop:694 length:330 start_codon:yes stop_codon:yes gene_type:complete
MENYESIEARLGEEILASDRSVAAISEIMSGVGAGVFTRMDQQDGWGRVPQWHGYLRRWRNALSYRDRASILACKAVVYDADGYRLGTEGDVETGEQPEYHGILTRGVR